MTAIEIIDETIEYYLVNPRGLNDNRKCVYISPSGNMCAVGRCLISPEDILNPAADSITDLEMKLKPEYRGHDVSFWSSLQTLHDVDGNWRTNSGPGGIKNELTDSGHYRVSKLKDIFK